MKLLVVRAITATCFLGAGAVFYLRSGVRTEALFLLGMIGVIYAHTFLYSVLFGKFPKRHHLLKVTLIGFDMLAVSLVIALTGGKSSPFIFLYPIIIIVATILFTKIAYYVTVAFAWVMYLLIVIYQTHFNLSLSGAESGAAVVWKDGVMAYTFFHLAGFLLIAMLSGTLATRVREAGAKLKESSESLKKLRSLHENILESITSGVITLGLDGRVISANRMAVRLLGKENARDVLDKSISTLIPAVDASEIPNWNREEVSYSAPGGSDRILGLSSSVLQDGDGNVKGHIIVFQDLTEIKELEEKLGKSEKLALLGQLAAGLAHEIRNPLSAISGALEIIGDERGVSEGNEKLLEVATKEVEKLNYLLEDFLILTYPSSQPDIPVDVGEIVKETVDSFMTAVRRSDICVSVDHREEGLLIVANPHRLKQVIWNLLQNAKHAMPEGGGINIEIRRVGGDVVISVVDEGVGIESENLSKIFDPFFSTKEVGSGLGLAIAQKVIDGYNGKINVHSSDNQGATFVITLPSFEGDISSVQFNHYNDEKTA